MDHLIVPLPAPVALAEGAGNFKLANLLIDRLLAGPLQPGLAARLEYERERLARLRLAYPHDRAAALS